MTNEPGEIGLLNADHPPQDILENIAAMRHGNDLIDIMRKLPMEYSVPFMMQTILKCSVQEVADYHKITRQAVDKKNKKLLSILRTSH